MPTKCKDLKQTGASVHEDVARKQNPHHVAYDACEITVQLCKHMQCITSRQEHQPMTMQQAVRGTNSLSRKPPPPFPPWASPGWSPGACNLLGVEGGGEEGPVGRGAQQDPHAGHEVLHGVQLAGAPHHLRQHGQTIGVQSCCL